MTFRRCYIARFDACTLTEQRVDERRRLERSEVVGTLAEPDQLDRHTQFLLDAEDDPPLAVPSSLVSTTPVISTTSANTRACGSPARSSRRAPATPRRRRPGGSPRRLTLPSSSIRPVLVCSRPAVSMTTTSAPESMPSSTASNATDAGSAPSAPLTTCAPTRDAQVCNWRRRRGRCRRRRAPRGDRRRPGRGPACRPSSSCRSRSPTTSSTDGLSSCGSALMERSSSGRSSEIRTSRAPFGRRSRCARGCWPSPTAAR